MPRKQAPLLTDSSRSALFYTGAALVGGGLALAATVALVRSTSQRNEGIKVKLTHEVDPATRALLTDVNTTAKYLAENGLRIRLFGKPT